MATIESTKLHHTNMDLATIITKIKEEHGVLRNLLKYYS